MKNIFTHLHPSKIKKHFLDHKIKSVLTVIVVGALLYYGYDKIFGTDSATVRYVLGNVEKGVLETSVSGTGQVSASNQLDIKSKVSGDIVSVNVKTGQQVSTGTLIAQVDSRDASITFKSAEVSYEKLTRPADAQDIEAAEDAITKAYTESWNSVATVFTNYASVVAGMKDMFYTAAGYLNNPNRNSRGSVSRALIDNASISFDRAKNQYEDVLKEYNSLSRLSPRANINDLIDHTHGILTLMSDALKGAQSVITHMYTNELVENTSENITAGSKVNSLLDLVNSYVASIVSAKNSIRTSENTLSDLKKGADFDDIRLQELSLQQKRNDYNDYFIRAPFNGIIASVPVKVGSPASGATIATIITSEKYAEISLNEVDIARVKNGQKATLTFDAIEGLTISGNVAEVNLVGTVDQGVVNYALKVAFKSDDNRIRPGMSISASIVTDIKENVLIVPASAVKTKNGEKYVEVFENTMPKNIAERGITSVVSPIQKKVTVGLSNDMSIEILSGLDEGDQIVVRSINPTASTRTTTQAPSLFGGGSRNSGTVRVGGSGER